MSQCRSTAPGERRVLVFVDLETCCRGPIKLDITHVPDPVCARYPGIDRVQAQECRRLVLAMIAAWRWDIRGDFPEGHRHGRDILELLDAGPPWPALGSLGA